MKKGELTLAELERCHAALMKASVPTKRVNGVPMYALIPDPSIPPEEVTLIQHWLMVSR